MVARRSIEGNDENSNGRETFTDTIIIIRPVRMLTVNKKSSIKVGSGTISIDIIRSTINGIPKLAALTRPRPCRKYDNEVFSIIVFRISNLAEYRVFVLL
tara:strand:+ start:2133 stop:2432 length:300 start_codon:yes stop_codon:yes gene_type:complete